MESGIYKITNLINRKCYIGSACNLSKRRHQHFDCSEGRYSNPHLQYSMRRYGKENFLWEILEECNKEDLINKEQYWLNQYDFENLYNINPKAGSPLGTKHSKTTNQKISMANKGKHFGPKSAEACKKMSEARKGIKLSEETKRKIGLGNKGKKISKKHKEILRKAHTGKIVSQETREKIRQINLGKKASIESRKKMSMAVRNRDDNYRKKLSIAIKKWWQQRKEINNA